jgi:MEMO1 family protein
MVRKARYAGSFYDSSPQALTGLFKQWFEQASLPDYDDNTIGVICPHAGYIYSGSCAAYSYKLLSQHPFKKAVIIHPSHRGNHFGYSLSPFTEYQTPLGTLIGSKELDDAMAAGSDQIDLTYHENEHSMEVQLPFLKYINPDVEILPIMLGNQCDKVSVKLAELLLALLDHDNNETVIIVSTDLSHYLSAHEAENMDGKLIGQVLDNDIDNFYHSITSRRTEACGFGGILSLMHLTHSLESSYFRKLHYTHSGYASGDLDQVVGYLAAALFKKE